MWHKSSRSAAGQACVEAKPFDAGVVGREIVRLRPHASQAATRTAPGRRTVLWLPPGRGRDQAKADETPVEVHDDSIEGVAGGGLIEGDYRRDYPAAYQDMERYLATLGNAILPRRVRATGLDEFVTSYMDVHFRAALRHRGITTVSMRADGDCFFATFLNDEAPPVVRQRLREVLGAEPTVAGIRAYMADFLAAEFARLNRDPHAETATTGFFPVADAGQADRVRRQNAFVHDIRTMGSYDNEASDRVPYMFATIFGVPIDLWQPRYRTPIGWTRDDQGVVPLTVIRHGAHYHHARTDDRREPTLVPPAPRPAGMGEHRAALGEPGRERKRMREDEPVSPGPAVKRVRRSHLGSNVHTNALFDERGGARPRMSAAEYRGFLEENIAGDRPMSFVVSIILRAGDVHQIPDVVDAVMRGYEGDQSRVGFVFGANRKENARSSAVAFGDTVTAVLSSLKYPAAIIDITFRGDFKPGTMRNTVLESETTRTLVSGFLDKGTYPYISVQDFDTGERLVPSGRHVFDHFAGKLEIADDIEPLRPMMFGGGYRPDPGETFKEGLREAVLEDMQTRDRLAAIHPLLSYIPEPNLYLDGTLLLREGSEIRFGPGSAEFGLMAEAMNVAYAAELSLERTLGRVGRRRARTAAANNAHPLRGVAFVTDFVAGATVTELTRFDEKFTGGHGTLPQSHVSLQGVRNQYFRDRGVQDGTSLSDYRSGRFDRYQEREPFRFQKTRYMRLPTGQRWEPLDAAEEEAMDVDPTGASLGDLWANRKSPHKAKSPKKAKPGGRTSGELDRYRLQIHKNELSKGLNRRISAQLSADLQDESLPKEERAAAAGVQPDEAVFSAHLTAVSDQASTLLSQLAAIRGRIDAVDAPDVQRSTLFGAIHRALGGDTAESLRSAVVGAMVTLAVKAGKSNKKKLSEQPILLQAVTRPYHDGDLVNAFVQDHVLAHVTGAESQDVQRAGNARDMAARAVATHLRRTVVVHLADGTTIDFEPFEGSAMGRVAIDLHVEDGRQIFTPHGEPPTSTAKSREVTAGDHGRDTTMDLDLAAEEHLPDVEAPSSAAENLLGEAGAADVAAYRGLLTHARIVLARIPVRARAEFFADASQRATSVHWTPPMIKSGMSRRQTDLALVVAGVSWIMAARRYLDRHRSNPWAVAENLSSHLADRLKTRGMPSAVVDGDGLTYRSSTYSSAGDPDEPRCVEVTAVRLRDMVSSPGRWSRRTG